MRKMLIVSVCAAVGCAGLGVAAAAGFEYKDQPDSLDLAVDGSTWISTMITPLDEARRDRTYKVFTQIYDFAGEAPITKAWGGKYTHHRGMYIGWSDTLVGGEDYDTWHMSNCYQEHVQWVKTETSADRATQVEEIKWCPNGKDPFIKEIRTITASKGENGLRVFDFQSHLTSLAGTIQLKGDLQHAGMQVRMDNEVASHEDTTQYTMPAGAEELDNDKVVGAWWMCCSPMVRDKRYWVLHMTGADNACGQPVYSIRRYARFGAFTEPTLEEGKPLTLNFRIIVSENELGQAQCQALYDAFTK
ncbi:MAG: hypothetical protein GY851_15725 [bacterium]|nr:hypothetical protein [bacterium]